MKRLLLILATIIALAVPNSLPASADGPGGGGPGPRCNPAVERCGRPNPNKNDYPEKHKPRVRPCYSCPVLPQKPQPIPYPTKPIGPPGPAPRGN